MGVGKWRGVGCWGFGAAAGGLMKIRVMSTGPTGLRNTRDDAVLG
jgi:hypothetical protein